jgi:hypothetical protein
LKLVKLAAIALPAQRAIHEHAQQVIRRKQIGVDIIEEASDDLSSYHEVKGCGDGANA